MSVEDESAQKRIEDADRYFGSLVDTIPVDAYIPADEREEQASWNRFGKNKKLVAPKQGLKEESKKGRRAKLDPDAHVSTTNMQVELSQKLEARMGRRDEGGSDSDDDGDDGDGDQEMEGNNSVDFTRKGDLEELRQRIRDKVNNARAARNAPAEGGHVKRFKGEHKGERAGAPSQPQHPRPQLVPKRITAKLKFSELDAKVDTGEVAKPNIGKAGSKTQRRKRLLEEARKEGEQAVKLQKTVEGRAQLHEKSWEKVLDKAQGSKELLDKDKLSKALKRDQAKKKKSAKKWKELKQQVQQHVKEKQMKRLENLKTKKERGKKAKKGGAKRAGFEGKKKDFLN